jgi:hypothetical protein
VDHLPKLIALTGQKFSGKDTVGEFYVQKYGYIRVAFADILREMIDPLLNVLERHHTYTERWVTGRTPEWMERKSIRTSFRGATSPRHLLQTLGTEWGRKHIDPDVWVWTAMRKVDQAWSNGHPVVITDLRFENEAQYVHDFGGDIIKIARPETDAASAPWWKIWGRRHASEISIDEKWFDYVITNDNTIEHLHARAERFLFEHPFEVDA